MKRVYLHFKEFELGFLTQEENEYIWVPNSKNIVTCFQKYDGARDMFFLGVNTPQGFNEIPYHFQEFLIAADREDFIDKAKINKKDSDFEKLYKMASLKYFIQDFYISL